VPGVPGVAGAVTATDEFSFGARVVAEAGRSTTVILDTSGSMIDKIGEALREIGKAVGGLDEATRFNLLLAADGKVTAFRARPVPAAGATKVAARKFLEDATSAGVTDLLPAIESALARRPESLWVVTDGDMPDNKAFLAGVQRANRGRHTRLHLIVLGDPYDTAAYDKARAFAVQLASQHGGKAFDVAGSPLTSPGTLTARPGGTP